MAHSENFISLLYSNVEFLIQKEAVDTAFSCSEKDILETETHKKVNYLSQQINCFDFDKYAILLNQKIDEADTRKCIILNTSNKMNDEGKTALISSADCRVKQISYKDFTLFSDLYSESLKKKGILACSFIEKNFISYLVDIESFLNYLEQQKICVF